MASLTGLGATVRLTASVRDQNGQTVSDASVTWQSSDASVATVSNQGLVTAVKNGSATITARSGSASATATVSVMFEVVNPRRDRETLVSLYRGTDGPNWKNRTNWLSDGPLNSWHGVTANAQDEVTALNLPDNQLTGSLPAELGQLARLEQLELSFNRLTGPIPAELGQLGQLRDLDLGYNQLTGPVPAEFGQLGQLRLLLLRSNQLSGSIPVELGRLARLDHLVLSRNFLSGPIPVELGKLVDLAGLNLSRNLLTGSIPAELGQLENLRELNLRYNRLTGTVPAELGQLVQLAYLSLDTNQLTGSVPVELGNVEGLTYLSLDATVCVPLSSQMQAWIAGIETRQGVVDCPGLEREALIALYHATGGPGWTNSSNWLSHAPLGDWYGVDTNGKGEVTAVILANNEMNGSLPIQMGNLSKLDKLDLSSNPSLMGTIPDSFTRVALETLALEGTRLCAPPDDGFRDWLDGIPHHTVAACTESRQDYYTLISIYRNTNGPGWSNSENWLSSEPLDKWYGVRTNAEGDVVSLELQNNNLSGPIPGELGQLANLEHLDLQDNRLTDPIPDELGGLVNLELLNLGFNGLTGPIPGELGQLANLEHLDLQDNRLTDPIPDELGRLVNLELLNLGFNQLTGTIPGELGQLAYLGQLDLRSNRLTGVIPAELGRLGQLHFLHLGTNLLTGPIPGELGQLAYLDQLYLQDNRLTGSIPAELGRLHRLLVMDLSTNRLTGSIPAELGSLQQLRALRLSTNLLTGSIPAELGQIRPLQSLWLSFNRLTGNLPAPLFEAIYLKDLALTANHDLSGTLPESITRLSLDELHLDGTRLCPPPDSGFREWLEAIPDTRLGRCDTGAGGSAVYLTQSTQSLKHPVPLVAGKDALLRVFITGVAGTEGTLPDVKATFYQEGVELYSVDIPGPGTPVPMQIDEGDLSASVNARIPGPIVVPGLEMVIDIDPEGTPDPALGIVDRLPPTGRLPVNVKDVPALDLTLVPFLWMESPDRSVLSLTEGLTSESDLFRYTRDLLPVQEFTLSVREPVWTSFEPDFEHRNRVLRETEVIRFMDGGDGHYMGTISGGGIAQLPGRVIASVLNGKTIAHELGHNMNLLHSPCGNPGGPDHDFPYDDGSVGAWGFDFRDEALVDPLTPDLMGYCEPVWISDYQFDRAMAYRMVQPSRSVAAYVPDRKGLLLWGGVNEYGELELDPAFAVDAPPVAPGSDGPYRITAEDVDGRVLFRYSFDMIEHADSESGSFVFVLPVRPDWPRRMARIFVSGPEGMATLGGRDDSAAALLLDRGTGMVRGILSDWQDYGATGPAARRLLPEPGLELMISRGVPDPADWDRQPR